MMHYYGNIWGLGGGINMILTLILIIILIVWAISASSRRHGYYYHDQGSLRQPQRNSALDILNERYAKGEINKDEYEQRKKDILS